MNALTSSLATRSLGARVRARRDIQYAYLEVATVEGRFDVETERFMTIEKGRTGVVQFVVGGGAIVGVQWDGDEVVARSTFLDFVELATAGAA